MKHLPSNQSLRAMIAALFLTLLMVSPALSQSQPVGRPEIRPGVRQAAQDEGRVRVIINLRLPQELERIQNTSGARMPMDQLQNVISDAQNSVLDTLEPERTRGGQFRSSRFELVHQYEAVAALAGYLTPEGVTALENHPLIESIQVDEMGTGGMAQGRNIVGAQYVQANFGITGQGQKVAIVDSGVDLNHPYLQDDINTFGVCYTFNDCGTQQNPNANLPQSGWADDRNGHGTAVSGIITSSSPNNPGVAPDVTIVPVRVLDRNNTGYVSDWVAGLNWVITNQGGLGVDVVSLSIQTNAVYTANCDAVYPSLASPVNHLVNNMSIPVVSITGNYGLANAISAPGCLSNAIAVGATYDYNGAFNETGCSATAAVDKVACFTDGGSMLDVVAPGAIIYAPNFITGQDSPWSGTSAAAPMVSGALAMMIQLAEQKGINYSPASLLTTMKQTGKVVADPRNGLTYRRLNIPAALEFYDRITAISPSNVDVTQGDPVFTWEDRTYANWFQIEIKNTTANQTMTKWIQRTGSICNGTTCSTRVGLNIVDGTNQWRVQTFHPGQGPGLWSDYKSFTAIGPVLSSPTGTITSATPTYVWLPVSGATWYQLYVTNGVGFTYSEWIEAAGICSGTCSYTPGAFSSILSDGSYTWYVKPWNGTFYGVWGGPKQFTVDVPIPSNPSSQAPTNINTNTPTFHWTPGGGGGLASYFQIRVRRSDNLAVVYEKWYTRPSACGSISGTTCSATPDTLLQNATGYVMDVLAWGPGGYSAGYSATQPFTIVVTAPVTPAGLQVSDNRGDPQFRWNYDSLALWYHLVVEKVEPDESVTTVLDKWYQVGETLSCTAVCGIYPGIYLTNGTYNWQVESWGYGGYSPASTFGQPIVLDYTKPYTPNNAAMYTSNLEVHDDKSRLVYTWADVTNDGVDNEASWYQLVIRDPGGTVLHQQWYRRYGNDCNEVVCNVSPPLYLTNGANYEWQVQGWGPGGIGDWSEPAQFTVAADSQAAKPDVTGATPSGATVNNSPTFTWTTRSGTTWAELHVVRGDNVQMYRKWLDVENLGCAGGSGTCTADQNALGGLVLNDNSYTFRLRFYGPGGTSPQSDPVAFSINGPVSGTVTTFNSPANNGTLTNRNVTFSWGAASNATGYRLRLVNVDAGTTTDEWFTSEAIGCAGGGTCSITRTLNPAIYDWTIATWGPGNVLPTNTYPESATQRFTILK